MARECVHDCKHPLWGGDGECIDDDPMVDLCCTCDTGYTSHDSMGNPSCVSKRALVIAYVTVAVVGFSTAIFFIWHAQRYRHLPPAARHTRRAAVRLRVILPSSLYSAGCALVFTVAAARTGNATLWDGGMLQVFYTFVVPNVAFAGSAVGELWVDALPSQMLPTDSLPVRLKALAEKHKVYVILAINGAVGMTVLGSMSFFVDPLLIVMISNLTNAACAASVAVCNVFVAVQITRVITRAQSKASTAAKGFYARAKRALFLQVLAMFGSSVVVVVSFAMLHLSEVGQHTPVIPIVVQAVDTMLGLSAAVFFTSSAPAKGRVPATSTVQTLERTINNNNNGRRNGTSFGSGSIRLPNFVAKSRRSSKRPAGDSSEASKSTSAQVIPTIVEEFRPPSSSTSSWSNASYNPC